MNDSTGHGSAEAPRHLHEPIDVSIIIVNWRSKDFVRQCLRSIEANAGGLTVEIIVVDGASFDGCGEMLAVEFPQARFIQASENRGFGYANNLGAKTARGHYLLLLNPDTELHPEALPRLVATHRAHPRCGLVGPRLLNTDGTLQKSCVQAFPTPLNQALGSEFLLKLMPNSRLWGSARAFASDEPTPVEAISGACMLIERSLYERLGGFDERYFMYAEDMDLCKRVSLTGHQVFHDPMSLVLHHGGQSSRTQPSRVSTIMMRISLEQYFRIHHGSTAAHSYRFAQLTSAAIRIIIILIRNPFTSRTQRENSDHTITKWKYVLSWSLSRNSSNTHS